MTESLHYVLSFDKLIFYHGKCYLSFVYTANFGYMAGFYY